ncbi:lysoplasmalogenase [Dietzia kunjamensis]|nr:lysoplasmalogenase [Dietzia kunjamensis]
MGDSLPKAVPGDARFLAMVGGFAVAQVLWIVAFTRVDRGRSPIAWTLLLIAVATALLTVTVPEAGVLAPAVVVYGLLLLAVAWLAAGHGWIGGLGGALFVLSDGLIALGAFRPDLVDWPERDLLVMATYVAAQALLVAVILLTRSPDRTFGRSPLRHPRARLHT